MLFSYNFYFFVLLGFEITFIVIVFLSSFVLIIINKQQDYEEAVKHNELLYQYFDMEKGSLSLIPLPSFFPLSFPLFFVSYLSLGIPPVAQFVFGSFLLGTFYFNP